MDGREFIENSRSGLRSLERFLAQSFDEKSTADQPVSLPNNSINSRRPFIAASVFHLVTMGVNQGPRARGRPRRSQSRAHDRKHRAARHRWRIPSPASAMRWVRGCSATRRICWAVTISRSRSTERRSRAHCTFQSSAFRRANSWAYDQILDGIESGKIKGLWVIATNTAHSWIQQKRARELLDKLDFLVVQDMYATTETAQQAHLVFPAAGWGEKDGTFINSERRFGLLKKVARGAGPGAGGFQDLSTHRALLGCADLFTEWTSPEAVFSNSEAREQD